MLVLDSFPVLTRKTLGIKLLFFLFCSSPKFCLGACRGYTVRITSRRSNHLYLRNVEHGRERMLHSMNPQMPTLNVERRKWSQHDPTSKDWMLVRWYWT